MQLQQLTVHCALQRYMITNNLVSTNNKSVFIEFRPKAHERNCSFLIKNKGKSIEQVNSAKFLGITLDYRCSWSEHIDNLCKRLASVCYVLGRLRAEVSMQLIVMYYFAHFHSLLSYGAIARGAATEADRVFILLKRALRCIYGVNSSASCRDFFRSLNVLTLPSVCIMQLLLYARRNLETINKPNSHHCYNTRNFQVLEVPLRGFAFAEKSPHYLAIKV
jgi:hypothetical protein